MLGAILLDQAPLRNPAPDLVTSVLLDRIRREGLGAFRWEDESTRLRQRLAFLHHQFGAPWPDVSEHALLEALERWLTPSLAGVRRRSELARVDPGAALLTLLGWEERQGLERLAPAQLEVPSGSRIRLDYTDPAAPVLPVRLQEVFGLEETPRIAGGKVPVTLHLLSPAHRPVQVTRDLAGFWRGGYFEVRKELKGRYPRHHWPDDPLTAEPTRRVRPTRPRPS
jgi:ATP-dependent helicase HrpB